MNKTVEFDEPRVIKLLFNELTYSFSKRLAEQENLHGSGFSADGILSRSEYESLTHSKIKLMAQLYPDEFHAFQASIREIMNLLNNPKSVHFFLRYGNLNFMYNDPKDYRTSHTRVSKWHYDGGMKFGSSTKLMVTLYGPGTEWVAENDCILEEKTSYFLKLSSSENEKIDYRRNLAHVSRNWFKTKQIFNLGPESDNFIQRSGLFECVIGRGIFHRAPNSDEKRLFICVVK